MLMRRSGKLVLGSGLSVWLWILILHMMAPPLLAQDFTADARRIGLGAIGKGSTASKTIDDERPYRAIVILFGLGLTGTFYTSGNEREPLERKESDMTKKRQTPEQIVTLLRQVEVAVANGKGTPQACKEAAITEQTYYRWRKEYGGLKLAQAKRLKELEKENSRLKHVVAELSLEKQILREVAQGNS